MIIPPGLVDVILSDKLTLEQKLDAIPKFSWPVVHLDGENAGYIEEAQLPAEDAALICGAVEKGRYNVELTPTGPTLNFYFTREDLTG